MKYGVTPPPPPQLLTDKRLQYAVLSDIMVSVDHNFLPSGGFVTSYGSMWKQWCHLGTLGHSTKSTKLSKTRAIEAHVGTKVILSNKKKNCRLEPPYKLQG